MNCKTKEMTSYQRLKWELEQLHTEIIQERTKSQYLKQALWKISNMKGPEVTEAPRVAFQALYKTNEEK